MRRPAATIDLLAWIAQRPRTYGEAIEAWRTSCPRLSAWDDAATDGLVRVIREPGREAVVALTPQGRALVELSAPPIA